MLTLLLLQLLPTMTARKISLILLRLGKDGKDKSNSIENQKELIQRYISCKESLQNVPVILLQ